jgi:hypothetical protein
MIRRRTGAAWRRRFGAECCGTGRGPPFFWLSLPVEPANDQKVAGQLPILLVG